MKYQILEKDKFKYISLILLNEIINFQHYFPVKITGDDTFLGQYLESMKTNGMLEIKDKKYIPTTKGREELVKLFAKYNEYLKIFDIYCAVDLEKGEFAFSSMNDDKLSDDDAWYRFLKEPRFSDVRIAVAEFKNIDAMEIVFMSFLNENKFDCTAPQWQYNLTGDSVWNEMVEICNTAVSSDYLKENGVLEDVIKKGTVIAMKIIKDAEENNENSSEENNGDTITETTTETTEEYVDVVPMPYYSYGYYDSYYDPFYVSPLWLVPAVLLF